MHACNQRWCMMYQDEVEFIELDWFLVIGSSSSVRSHPHPNPRLVRVIGWSSARCRHDASPRAASVIRYRLVRLFLYKTTWIFCCCEVWFFNVWCPPFLQLQTSRIPSSTRTAQKFHQKVSWKEWGAELSNFFCWICHFRISHSFDLILFVVCSFNYLFVFLLSLFELSEFVFQFLWPNHGAISVLSRGDTVHNIDQPSQWERETRLNAPELVSKTHTKPGQGTVCSFLDSGACLILTPLTSCIFHPYKPYLQKERETGVLSNISVLCWGDTVHDIDQPRLYLLQTQAYPQYPLCPLRYWPVSMLPTSFSSDAITPTVPIAPTTVPMPSTISTHLNGPVAIFFETRAYILFLYNTHNNGLCVVCIIDLSQVCQYIICNALIISTTSNVIKYLRLILILHSRGTFQENNWQLEEYWESETFFHNNHIYSREHFNAMWWTVNSKISFNSLKC